MTVAVTKLSFDDFICTCTPLLKIPELEQQRRERVQCIMMDLWNFNSEQGDPVQNLKQFLNSSLDKRFFPDVGSGS